LPILCRKSFPQRSKERKGRKRIFNFLTLILSSLLLSSLFFLGAFAGDISHHSKTITWAQIFIPISGKEVSRKGAKNAKEEKAFLSLIKRAPLIKLLSFLFFLMPLTPLCGKCLLTNYSPHA
jgi:hypothetical protein